MKPKVLIIEEKKRFAEIKKILNGCDDWELTFVATVEKALNILEAGRVAVVVCSLNFKGIDCLSFPYEINKNFEDINVILLDMHGKDLPREIFLRTSAFDLVQCEQDCQGSSGLVESIEVAVKAKTMRDTGSIKRPVFEGGKT